MKKKLTIVSGLLLVAGFCISNKALAQLNSEKETTSDFYSEHKSTQYGQLYNEESNQLLRTNLINGTKFYKARNQTNDHWDAVDSNWADPYFKRYSFNVDGTIKEEIGIKGVSDTMSRTFYTYTADKKVAEIIYQNLEADVLTNNIKNIYTYNSNGIQIVYLSQFWINNEWQNSTRRVTEYDNKGLETETRHEDFEDGTWKISNAWRWKYTFNTNGSPSESAHSYHSSGSWIDLEKHLYTYDNQGVLIQIERQLIDQATQMTKNYERIIDLKWFNWNGFKNVEWDGYFNSGVKSYTLQTWNVTSYSSSKKYSIVKPDAYGSTVKLVEESSNGGLSWAGKNRFTDENDEHGNKILLKNESFDGINWVINAQNRNLIKYDSNASMTENISQRWSTDNLEYYNSERSIFNDFQTFGDDSVDVGISEIVAFTNFNIYPNPSTSTTEIKYTLKKNVAVSVDVYNALGIKVKSVVNAELQPAGTYNYTFNPEVAGMYFVRVQQDDKTATLKLITLK